MQHNIIKLLLYYLSSEEKSNETLQKSELHRKIWSIADNVRGSVDGWKFKQYILGILFYKFISENIGVFGYAYEFLISNYASAAGVNQEVNFPHQQQHRNCWPQLLFMGKTVSIKPMALLVVVGLYCFKLKTKKLMEIFLMKTLAQHH